MSSILTETYITYNGIEAPKFLRCPDIRKVVSHFHCKHCDNMKNINSLWIGRVPDKVLRTKIECLVRSTLYMTWATEQDEIERLSEL